MEKPTSTIILLNNGKRERTRIAIDMINLYRPGHKAYDLSAENAVNRHLIKCTKKKHDRMHVLAQHKYCKG